MEAGTSISVEDAVMALIVKSANDVATVVAENISGTEKEFAKLMTSYARKLGMNKTTFKNAHGLPNRAQMTTARDISILSHAFLISSKQNDASGILNNWLVESKNLKNLAVLANFAFNTCGKPSISQILKYFDDIVQSFVKT